ncbi:hypothetical protein FM120_06570 [Sphingobacterium faecium PCAi_F2.5]|nr:hypothetical protein FM120_06570 [Sphingobacterium faecium PCAi_F2.5]
MATNTENFIVFIIKIFSVVWYEVLKPSATKHTLKQLTNLFTTH